MSGRRVVVLAALLAAPIGSLPAVAQVQTADIEGAFAKGARETIVVMPDSKTVHNGSL